MENYELIARLIYLLAIIGYVVYFITENSLFMLCGGLLLIVASIITIIINKKALK